jgi:imidazolonepropionase-like amidohydrolase
MRLKSFSFTALCLFLIASHLQSQQSSLAPTVRKYVRVDSPKVVLTHVRVIDGTGKTPVEEQNVVIQDGRIAAIQAASDVASAPNATVLDLHGYSVMPGIVGMHNHLYYLVRPNFNANWDWEQPPLAPQMSFSAPRLYLAVGVTTMRTTGSVETYADLNLKRLIDAGKLPGPHMDVTGPYLEGTGSFGVQLHELTGPDDARQIVNYWANRGVTSFKAYMNITRAELGAAIEEAHKRGLKVTGHLCSITYLEAVALGIDDLEHGFFVNTQLDPGKKPDQCSESEGDFTLEHMDPGGKEAEDLINLLIQHHVAITSTLPVFEDSVPGRPPLRQALLEAMSPQAREAYLYIRNRPASKPLHGDPLKLFKRDMQLEREFALAGGLLLAGPDPTGDGGVLPGFGDQREIELLVEAGFTAVEAIKVATLNGATYLGRQAQIGSIEVGKNADLIVIKGNPAAKIDDVENVEIVFKDGVGYDSKKLLDSVKGRYGEY